MLPLSLPLFSSDSESSRVLFLGCIVQFSRCRGRCRSTGQLIYYSTFSSVCQPLFKTFFKFFSADSRCACLPLSRRLVYFSTFSLICQADSGGFPFCTKGYSRIALSQSNVPVSTIFQPIFCIHTAAQPALCSVFSVRNPVSFIAQSTSSRRSSIMPERSRDAPVFIKR